MKKILAFLLASLFLISLCACSKKAVSEENKDDTLRVSDKYAAGVFSSSIDELEGYSGAGRAVKTEDGKNKLEGLAVVRILEFNGDKKHELVTIYSDKNDPDTYWMEITGFDAAPANLKFWDDSERIKVTSKSSEDSEAPCVWFYTEDSGNSYLVFGDDLSKSADYYGYVQMRGDESVYKFQHAFTETNGNHREGTYEKIELVGMSDEEVKAHFEKNESAINIIESAK